MMNSQLEYEQSLQSFLNQKQGQYEHLTFPQSCHSVEDAAKAANAHIDEFIKNICMVDDAGNLIVAIVRANDRASTSRVAKALNIENIRLATPEEILDRTGYPCGGTPSFGFQAKFLIDPTVLELETIYTGGGSENSLIKVNTKQMLKLNNGEVVRIRK